MLRRCVFWTPPFWVYGKLRGHLSEKTRPFELCPFFPPSTISISIQPHTPFLQPNHETKASYLPPPTHSYKSLHPHLIAFTIQSSMGTSYIKSLPLYINFNLNFQRKKGRCYAGRRARNNPGLSLEGRQVPPGSFERKKAEAKILPLRERIEDLGFRGLWWWQLITRTFSSL